MRRKGTVVKTTNIELQLKATLDQRHLVDSYADLLAFTKADFIPKGFFVSVVDDNEALAGIYRCIDDNLSNTPANNAAKWKHIPETGGNAVAADVAQTADYVLSITAGVVKATPAKSTMPVFTDASASVVLQAVINKLAEGNKGSIHVSSGVYPFTSEVVINGVATERPPKDQIKLTGNGFSTIFTQNIAGLNAFVLQNRSSICFRDFLVLVGSSGKSGILGYVPNGSSEPSVFGGVIDNVFVANSSTAYAPIDISNQFDLHMQTVFAYNTGVNATAIRIQQVGDGSIRYGNSSFGFLRAFTRAGGTGLHLKGLNQYRPINLMQFSNYEFAPYGEGASRGVFLEGASNCTFTMSDIEYCQYPIWLDNVAGDDKGQSINNKFLSGYLYPQGANARAITVNNASSGGNDFVCKIETDDTSTALVLDKMSFSNANRYDLSLGYTANHTGDNIKIESPNNVLLTIRPLLTDAIVNVPTPAQGDISNRSVNTAFLYLKNYLNKATADDQYLNRYASNALGRLGVDVWGVAGNTERVDGAVADLKNIGQDEIVQGVAIGQDYKLKGYTPFAWRIFLGLMQSAFYDYQPAKIDGQFFTNARTVTQPIYDDSGYLATTAHVRKSTRLNFQSILVADTPAFTPEYMEELVVFEGYMVQTLTIVTGAAFGSQVIFRNDNGYQSGNNAVIYFSSGNNFDNRSNPIIILEPGQCICITYAYANNWRKVYHMADPINYS